MAKVARLGGLNHVRALMGHGHTNRHNWTHDEVIDVISATLHMDSVEAAQASLTSEMLQLEEVTDCHQPPDVTSELVCPLRSQCVHARWQ